MQHCESECPICGTHADQDDPDAPKILRPASRADLRKLERALKKNRAVEFRVRLRCDRDNVEWNATVNTGPE